MTALPEGVAERVERFAALYEGQQLAADLRALLAAARGSEGAATERASDGWRERLAEAVGRVDPSDEARHPLTTVSVADVRAALATPPVPLDREAAIEAITAAFAPGLIGARSYAEAAWEALAPLLGTETTGGAEPDRVALADLLDEALTLRNTIYYADEVEPGPVESAANRLGAVLGDLRAALGIVSPGSAP